MRNTYKYLDEKNALAILPIPAASLYQLDEMLDFVNRGEYGGSPGCITKLILINKKIDSLKSLGVAWLGKG